MLVIHMYEATAHVHINVGAADILLHIMHIHCVPKKLPTFSLPTPAPNCNYRNRLSLAHSVDNLRLIFIEEMGNMTYCSGNSFLRHGLFICIFIINSINTYVGERLFLSVVKIKKYVGSVPTYCAAVRLQLCNS